MSCTRQPDNALTTAGAPFWISKSRLLVYHAHSVSLPCGSGWPWQNQTDYSFEWDANTNTNRVPSTLVWNPSINQEKSLYSNFDHRINSWTILRTMHHLQRWWEPLSNRRPFIIYWNDLSINESRVDKDRVPHIRLCRSIVRHYQDLPLSTKSYYK